MLGNTVTSQHRRQYTQLRNGMKVLTVWLKTAMDEIAAVTFDVSHLLALGLVDCFK